jgi:YidC/Oxa1 family membrane protein insertase
MTNQQRAAQNNEATSEQKQETTDIRVILPEEEPGAAAADGLPSAQFGQPDPSLDADSAAGEIVRQAVADTIIIETNRLIAEISTKGARIISLKMKDYDYAGTRSGEMIDLIPAGSAGGAQLSVNNESFDDVFFTILNDDINVDTDVVGNNINDNNDNDDDIGNSITDDNINSDDVDNDDTDIADAGAIANIVVTSRHYITIDPDADYALVLEARSATTGHPIRKIFSFSDDTYRIGYAISGRNLTGRNVTLGWEGGIDDTEADVSVSTFGGGIDNRRAHYSDAHTVNHFEMKRRGVETPSGFFRWVGKSSKYFFIAVVAEETVEADIKIEGRDVSARSASSANVDIDYSVSFKFEAGSDEIENWIYAGPGSIRELSAHGMKFEKALFPVLSWARHIFWADAWFPPLAELILRLLLFFYGIAKDYGLAIFLLTALTKIVTYPLTRSSMKSMMKMKDIQPKIVALRQKYKGNPQKMNEETMALYKAEGVNPFNPGCLPMFLQMPIFIALFVVLRKAVELRGTTSWLLPWVKDLAQPEALFYLPFAVPIYGSNVALMPIIMAALTFFQQKQTITDPNQKMMIYMMPILMLVMFNGFPAGVVFYWTISSAFGLAQQALVKRKNLTPATTVVSGTPPSAKPTTATVVKTSARKKSSGGRRKRK